MHEEELVAGWLVLGEKILTESCGNLYSPLRTEKFAIRWLVSALSMFCFVSVTVTVETSVAMSSLNMLPLF